MNKNYTHNLSSCLNLLFIFLLFSFYTAAQTKNSINHPSPRTIITASNFGVKANSGENAATALQKAIAACHTKKNPVLVLPGGRIDVWEKGAAEKELYISNCTENDSLPKTKHIALPLDGFANLTIEGNNTLIVLHGKMISFSVISSKNVTIKNLAFDYERPTMSELTVTKISSNSIETTIHPDSKYTINNGKISFYGEGWETKSFHTIIFSPAENRMRYGNFSPFLKSTAKETAKNTVDFEGNFSDINLKVGDILTVRDPYRDNCGGFIWLSKNIVLQNIHMYYMHGLGIVAQFSENLTYKNIQAAPQKTSGRIISSFADCFHFSGCKGKILMDSCITSGSHDDPINIHGTHLAITRILQPKKIRVRFMHHQTYGFSAFFRNDSIAFIHPQTLQPLAYGKIVKATLLNEHEMELQTDKPIPADIKEGICIENITCTPEVIIRNCQFERTNTRGVLITTRRKVLLENNYFLKTGMHAILIGNDASSWYESGPVHDVIIRNNIFEDCGYNQGVDGYTIAIAPENHQLVEQFYVHENIRIYNNVFKLSRPAILFAKSVDGLKFEHNNIEQTGTKSNSAPVIFLEACKDVTVDKNSFGDFLPAIIQIKRMKYAEMHTDLQTNVD